MPNIRCPLCGKDVQSDSKTKIIKLEFCNTCSKLDAVKGGAYDHLFETK